ncbi:MAG: shikimate dehydrogenase [Vicinamibacterales bacterium]
MRPRSGICATVTAATTAELRRRRDAVVGADLVELRLDSVADPDVAGALAGRRTPVIVTCRPTWEGGAFAGTEEERQRLLNEALARGAEYVDVEWRAGFSGLIASSADRIVLSSHDFTGIPIDLDARINAMRAAGARFVKVAVTPSRLSDVLVLQKLGAGNDTARRTVLIAMGERGLTTRILPERFGSAWTYAGDLGDVGQVTIASLLDFYRFREVTEDARLYGVAGSPVSHSVSPAMHNASFRALGENAVYLPLPAADADDLLAFARGMGLSGASVTIPFKVPLLELLDTVDAKARDAGAVNTIRQVDGGWAGTNTDIQGFLAAFDRRGIALKGVRVSVLGAGGAARAVTMGLASRGAHVSVHARDTQAAAAVAALGAGQARQWPPMSGSWDVLVNCTPVGMHPNADASPLAGATIDGRVVYDLVYNPEDTRLLRDARAAGAETIGGLDMLVAQAEAQCEWWTGKRPPDGVMRSAAIARLSEFTSNAHDLV